ncbi:MAG: hypothetical protein BWY86_01334 [Candidatus Aminicenantes bacterium ADurb.Bin508]|nr:MAG: hypothetical protein BWY86_01334 [Candidatus Aminicenantes bacterium ADurb.Bin508]
MTQLVGHGGDRVELPGEVEQDVGVVVVDRTVTVGSGTFVLVGVAVHPPLLEGGFQEGGVLISQGGHGADHHLPGLLPGEDHLGLGHRRGVKILVTEAFKLQQALFQPEVPVQDGEVLLHRFDQPGVDFPIDGVGKEGLLETTGEASRPGLKEMVLDSSVQEGGEGIAETPPVLPVAAHGADSVLPLLVPPVTEVGAMGEGEGRPVHQGEGGGGDLHVVELFGRLLRGLREEVGRGEKPLLGCGEDVGGSAEEVLQHVLVGGKGGSLFEVTLDSPLSRSQEGRLQEGHGGAPEGRQGLRRPLGLPGLRLRQVGVRLKVGVGVYPLEPFL